MCIFVNVNTHTSAFMYLINVMKAEYGILCMQNIIRSSNVFIKYWYAHIN